MIRQAVILAAGLGTRMQKKEDNLSLNHHDNKHIDAGLKGMILADDDRPLFDSSISNLIDAGINHIIFVVKAESREMLKERYEKKLLGKVKLSFAIQKEPLGTANAVLAAENYTRNEPFLVMCFDNIYPLDSLKKIVSVDLQWSVLGYDRDALEDPSLSNLRKEKIRRSAVLQSKSGVLLKIVEAAENQEIYNSDGKILIGMGLFGFTQEIYEACKKIKPRERVKGKIEYELPDAVQYGIEMGRTVKVIYHYGGVIDLTAQIDIDGARRLSKNRKLKF